jgi:RNA polymerase sigma factor (TIGR02999 family)
MDIKKTLSEAAAGGQEAADRLTETLYAELGKLASKRMRGERSSHTLQTMDLLNEAMGRLMGDEKLSVKDRQHFIALSSRAMQRVLVDHARKRNADRRGGHRERLSLESIQPEAPVPKDNLQVLAEALEQLERIDVRKGQVARLRLLGGMTVPEVAEVMEVSTNTVDRDWKQAKEWLLKSLS